MKKLLFSFVLMICAVFTAKAQADMFFTITGNNVTFTVKPTTPGDWNGSNPLDIYAYTNASDTTPTGTAETELLGVWPGTPLTNNNDGSYSTTVDLSKFFAAGVTVNNINFIYSDGGPNQNPAANQPGFSATDNTHATGWKAVTITSTLATLEAALNGKTVVANGKLYTSKKGNLTLSVFDVSGKLVKTIAANADGNPIELNITQPGVYMVKVAGAAGSEVVKFVK